MLWGLCTNQIRNCILGQVLYSGVVMKALKCITLGVIYCRVLSYVVCSMCIKSMRYVYGMCESTGKYTEVGKDSALRAQE